MKILLYIIFFRLKHQKYIVRKKNLIDKIIYICVLSI